MFQKITDNQKEEKTKKFTNYNFLISHEYALIYLKTIYLELNSIDSQFLNPLISSYSYLII